jgi:MFS family permease
MPVLAALAASPSAFASTASTVVATGTTSAAIARVSLAASTAASAPDLATLIGPFTPDAIANGFSTLIGALLGALAGAMLAYLLQRRFQRTVEHKSELIAAHRLMFALLQQINTIVLIQRDYVYAELGNPGRFLSIPSTPQFDASKNTLELPELTFLLPTKQSRTILYEFYLAQENYIEAVNQWNMRSQFHFEKVQPALAASGIQSGSTISEDDLRRAIGIHNFGTIVNSTNNCIEALRRAFQKLADVKVNTRSYLVLRFKSNDFTDFDFPDTYGLTEEANQPK